MLCQNYLWWDSTVAHRCDGSSWPVCSRYVQGLCIGISVIVFVIVFIALLYCFIASSYLAAGVQAVIGDVTFHTLSPVAANLLSAAEKLEKWLVHPENRLSAEGFLSLLLSSLKACVPCNVTSTKSREKIWSSYHQLRCSDVYISRWQCFLKRSLGEKGHPIFYQSIGNAILEKLLRERCSVSQSAGTDQQTSIMTQELNALRYAAGYIPRALLKKLKKSAHPLKDELQLCLLDLLDDGDKKGGTAEE